MDIYLSTAYLAPIEYYSKLVGADRILIESGDNYIKQTYRNRCSIIAANGIMPLSIPIEKPQTAKCRTKDIRIAEHGNWRHLHWNSIVSAYNSTPFFEYFADDLRPFYEKQFEFLFDFNEQLRELIFSWIGLNKVIHYTKDFKTELSDNELDLREIIHPKKDWKTLDSHFLAEPYYQVFEEKFGFLPNQSIIDLVFNMGNESLLILERSRKQVKH